MKCGLCHNPVCSNCLSKRPWCIPVLNPNPKQTSSFEDVKLARVSLKCLKVLTALYERPLLLITKWSPLLLELTFLKQFLALKQKLLVVFDTICRPSLVIKALSESILHWLFPGNVLSLADIHALYVSQGETLHPYIRINNFFSSEEVNRLEYTLQTSEIHLTSPAFISTNTMTRLDKLTVQNINSNSIIKLARIIVRLFKVHIFKCQVILTPGLQTQLTEMSHLPKAEYSFV